MRIPGAAVVAAVVTLGSAACSTTSRSPTVPPSDPQATSIVTPGGSYATVAMGDLADPANTFWQLLVRPAGSPAWSDQVEAAAVATNGGIILAAAAARVEAASRPSNLLSFTPLISTTDGGRAWVPDGLVPSAVAATPDSVATGTVGLLAIASGRVLQRESGRRDWTTVATLKDLPDTGSCRPTRIAAVAYLADQPVVGVDCARAGVAGLFVSRAGSWTQDGPLTGLPGPVRVLGLRGTGPGLTALLQAGREVVAAWRTATGWTVSVPLAVTGLVSTGPAGRGWFVLDKDLAGRAVTGPGSAWGQLPTAPGGTATLVLDGAKTDALAVAPTGTVLTVWTLSPGGSDWVETQSLKVPIQFGSSG